jgi:hypothetical protein
MKELSRKGTAMLLSSNVIVLPGRLQDRVDSLTKALFQPDHSIDFSVPTGESALVEADSVSWRVFKRPVSLYIGGITALLLEFGEPRVREGSGNTAASARIR